MYVNINLLFDVAFNKLFEASKLWQRRQDFLSFFSCLYLRPLLCCDVWVSEARKMQIESGHVWHEVAAGYCTLTSLRSLLVAFVFGIFDICCLPLLPLHMHVIPRSLVCVCVCVFKDIYSCSKRLLDASQPSLSFVFAPLQAFDCSYYFICNLSCCCCSLLCCC